MGTLLTIFFATVFMDHCFAFSMSHNITRCTFNNFFPKHRLLVHLWLAVAPHQEFSLKQVHEQLVCFCL